MSYSSVERAANDPQLQERVKAAVYKILYEDDECRSSIFGQNILNSSGGNQLSAMNWAVAVATEAAYATAVQSGRGAPGHDVDVIPDSVIGDVLQLMWPMQQPPVYPAP